MIRCACIGVVGSLALGLGACSHDSNTRASDDSYRDRDGYRTSERYRTDDGYRSGERYRGGETDGVASATTGTHTARYDQQDSRRARQTSWETRSPNDRDMAMVSDSSLPGPVRAGLSRESGGAVLRETAQGTWEGRNAYSARITRNGHDYKVITDAAGDLLAMRRID